MTVDRPRRTALVTGAGAGIGQAIAVALASAGHLIVLAGRRVEALGETAECLPSPAVILPMDAADPNSIDLALTRLGEQGIAVDILVNNAGLMGNSAVVGTGLTRELRRSLDSNLMGPALLCEALVPGMTTRGWGRVVNIASTAGQSAPPGQAPYSVSKAAVIALTKALAVDCAGRGVTVNAIAPGPVETARYRATKGPDAIRSRAQSIPTGQLSRPEDVAQAVAFLVSDAAQQITGQTITIDGGEQAAGPYTAMYLAQKERQSGQ
jgi:NAD(P)-dependent dehydrogenase (short-subunit alcohol dehydrogenase family)